MTTVGRKADHLRIAAGADVAHAGGTGFERIRLRHRALPERDLADVSLETELLGARLGAPLIVSAMTGGTDEAEVDQRRGWRAPRASTGSGSCSARAARCSRTRRCSRPTAARDRPPLLLGNLGAAQVGLPDAPSAPRAWSSCSTPTA